MLRRHRHTVPALATELGYHDPTMPRIARQIWNSRFSLRERMILGRWSAQAQATLVPQLRRTQPRFEEEPKSTITPMDKYCQKIIYQGPLPFPRILLLLWLLSPRKSERQMASPCQVAQIP